MVRILIGGGRIVLNKIRRRVSSLLIPYFIGTLFALFVYYAFSLFSFSQGASKEILAHLNGASFLDALRTIFWDQGDGFPIIVPLWFLRNLLVVVALTPILHLLGRFRPWLCLPLLVIYYFYPHSTSVVCSLFWFLFGELLLSIRLPRQTSLLFIPYVLVYVLVLQCDHSPWELLILAIGVVAAWSLLAELSRVTFPHKDSKVLVALCSFTFFIYLYHPAIIGIFRASVDKVVMAVTHSEVLATTVAYFISPIILVAVFTLFAYYFAPLFPRLFAVIAGGRSMPKSDAADGKGEEKASATTCQ